MHGDPSGHELEGEHGAVEERAEVAPANPDEEERAEEGGRGTVSRKPEREHHRGVTGVSSFTNCGVHAVRLQKSSHTPKRGNRTRATATSDVSLKRVNGRVHHTPDTRSMTAGG